MNPNNQTDTGHKTEARHGDGTDTRTEAQRYFADLVNLYESEDQSAETEDERDAKL